MTRRFVPNLLDFMVLMNHSILGETQMRGVLVYTYYFTYIN